MICYGANDVSTFQFNDPGATLVARATAECIFPAAVPSISGTNPNFQLHAPAALPATSGTDASHFFCSCIGDCVLDCFACYVKLVFCPIGTRNLPSI